MCFMNKQELKLFQLENLLPPIGDKLNNILKVYEIEGSLAKVIFSFFKFLIPPPLQFFFMS